MRGDRDLTDLLGSRSALLAVAEPARAYVISALATITKRRPIVVITATSNDADRLAHDLRAYLGEHQVDVFPAWETLPFERVSPSVAARMSYERGRPLSRPCCNASGPT